MAGRGEVSTIGTGRSVSGTGTVGSPAGSQAFAVSGGTVVGTAVALPLTVASEPIPGSLTGMPIDQGPGRVAGSFSGPSGLSIDGHIELVAR